MIPRYGARPLNRLIQTKILNPIAEYIVRGQMTGGGIISLGVRKGEITVEAVVKAAEKKGKAGARKQERRKLVEKSNWKSGERWH